MNRWYHIALVTLLLLLLLLMGKGPVYAQNNALPVLTRELSLQPSTSGTLTTITNKSTGGGLLISTLPTTTNLNDERVLLINTSNEVTQITLTNLLGTTAWRLTGNSGTDSTTAFIGTTDEATGRPLILKTDGAERMRITGTGSIGIGTSNPSALLDVGGSLRASGTVTLGSVATGTSADEVLLINGSNQVTKTTRANLVAGSGWALTGNAGTVAAGGLGNAPNANTNFIGTTDAVTLSLVTNNVIEVQIGSNGVLQTAKDMLVRGVTVGRGTSGDVSSVALGSQALGAISNTGLYNTGVGAEALKANTSGLNNTAVGALALRANTTGQTNTAVGASALPVNTTGGNNTAIGYRSLHSNSTGAFNTAVGEMALERITTGSNNTALGRSAGIGTAAPFNLTGSNSVFVGSEAQPLSDAQTNQIVIGYQATGLGSNSAILGNSSITATRLQGRVGIGMNPTGASNVTGLFVRAGSSQSTNNLLEVQNNAGTAMLAVNSVGNIAMVNPTADGATTSIAFGNQGSGYGALLVKNATLNNQIFDFYFGRHGSQTGAQLRFHANTSASSEVMRILGTGDVGIGVFPPTTRLDVGGTFRASGTTTLTDLGGPAASSVPANFDRIVLANSSGVLNEASISSVVAAGIFPHRYVGSLITIGDQANGSSALYNAALGVDALDALTTGTENTAVGYGALTSNTTGSENTAIGNESMRFNSTGNKNTAVGDWTLADLTTGSYNIALGYNAGLGAAWATDNYRLYIGAVETETFIYGNMETRRLIINRGPNSTDGLTTANGPALQVNTYYSANKGLVVRGAASQSQNLLELQTSAGAALFTASSTGALTLNPYGTSAGNTNELLFKELASNGTNYIGFKAADAISTDVVWTLPSADGSANQALTTNGTSVLGWSTVLTPTTGWSTTGNSGTNPTNNFIGTTDSQDFVVKTANSERVRMKSTGQVGIGTDNPAALLDVAGTFRSSGTVTLTSVATGAAADDVLLINSSNQVTKTTRAELVAGSGWALTGNTGTDPVSHFLGTTDAKDLVFRTNNTERVRIQNSTGRLSTQADAQINGLLVGRGGGSVATNVAIGGLGDNTTGSNNVAIGDRALSKNTTGANNIVLGVDAARDNLTGSANVIIGQTAMLTNTGSENVAIGHIAGRYAASAEMSIANSSVFLGANTRAAGNNETNQIVIGGGATGLGSNTAILGNNSITATRLQGRVGIGATPTTATGDAQLQVTASAAANRGLTITGAASQSANLIEARNNVGTAMFSVNNVGNLAINNPTADGATTSIAFGNQGSGYGALLVKNATLNSQVFDFYFGRHPGQAGAQLRFWRDQATEVMRIMGTGDVGIGVFPPAHKLDVGGTFRASGTVTLTSVAAGVAADDVLLINSSNQVTKTTRADLFANSGWALAGNNITDPTTQFLGTTSAQPLVIRTNNTEQMRVTSAGNVGIGTSSPNAPLQFGNTVASRKVVMWDEQNNDNQFYGFGVNAGLLRYQTANTSADHVFFSGVSGSTSQELMRIRGNGNVGIGDASPSTLFTVGSGGLFRVTSSGAIAAATGITADGTIALNTQGVAATTIGNTTTSTSVTINTGPSGGLTLGGIPTGSSTDDVLLISSANRVTKTTRADLFANSGWALTGNNITDPTTQFLGTTSAQPLVIRTNNTEKMRITSDGNVGIGTQTANARLDVAGTVRATDALTLLNSGGAMKTMLEFNAERTGAANGDGIQIRTRTGESGTFAQGILKMERTNGGVAFIFMPSFNGSPSTLNGTPVESMRLVNRSMGLGTSNPTERLHLSGGNLLIDTLTSGTAAALRFMNPARTFTTGFKAGEQTADITYTLPTANGSSGQVLTTDGSGTLSWSTALTATSGWSTTGNTGTDSTINFLGTTDARPLVVKIAGTERVRIDGGGVLSTNKDLVANGVRVGSGGGGFSTNTAVGLNALQENTTGELNTALGTEALYANTIGNSNTGTGRGTLRSNIDGNNNTAVGSLALYYNTSGSFNTAIGRWALHQNTTASSNIAVGTHSMYSNTTGQLNTGLGFEALYSNVTGSSNVAIGYQAGKNETGSNKLYIANSDANNLIYGDFSSGLVSINAGATPAVPGASLQVNAFNASTKGMIVKGAASASANLVEVQNSSGTALVSISSAGLVSASAGVNLSGTTSPLQANGSEGTSGEVLTSAGPGATPTWTSATSAVGIKSKGVSALQTAQNTFDVTLATLDAGDAITVTLEGADANAVIPSFFVVRTVSSKFTVYFSAPFTGYINWTVMD